MPANLSLGYVLPTVFLSAKFFAGIDLVIHPRHIFHVRYFQILIRGIMIVVLFGVPQ